MNAEWTQNMTEKLDERIDINRCKRVFWPKYEHRTKSTYLENWIMTIKNTKANEERQPNILYSAFYHLIYISVQLCWYLFFILAFHYFIFLKWGCHSLFHVEYLWSWFSFLDKYFLFLYSLIKSLVETFTCTCVWLCPFVEFHSQFPVHSRLVL